ncbi:MAG TPA: site-specific integrase [Peptococcaceae bacterium]|nr:site-specific integrase [Peptococcaceae bacterium]
MAKKAEGEEKKKKKTKKRGNNEGTIVQRPDGRWMAQITVGYNPVNGNPKRRTFYGKTRKEVVEKMDAARAEIRAGTYVEPTKLTTGDWIKQWLVDYMKPSLRTTTWASYDHIAKLHIIPVIGKIPLNRLTTSDLQKLYSEKLANGRVDGKGGLSIRTVRYIHQIIHGALEKAKEVKLVQSNVSEATNLPKLKYKEKMPLTSEQVRRFKTVIKQDRLYAAFLLELATGLRRGELLALKWEDIDLEKGVLSVKRTITRTRIEGGKTKTGLVFQEPKTDQSKRTVPIPASVVAELKAHKARQAQEKLRLGGEIVNGEYVPNYKDNGLVFCTVDGKPLDPRNLLRTHTRLLEKAKLPHVSFHDLRHTFATIMMEMDENPRILQEILGHANVNITLGIYSHPTHAMKERAAAKMDAFLTGKTEGKEKLPVEAREQ